MGVRGVGGGGGVRGGWGSRWWGSGGGGWWGSGGSGGRGVGGLVILLNVFFIYLFKVNVKYFGHIFQMFLHKVVHT